MNQVDFEWTELGTKKVRSEFSVFDDKWLEVMVVKVIREGRQKVLRVNREGNHFFCEFRFPTV